MTAIVKAGQPLPAVSLLPPWLSFLCAGLCSSVAGYLVTTVPTWLRVYAGVGVELPYVTQLVVDAPIVLPVTLVLVAGALLAGGAIRSRSEWVRGARPVACLVAIGVALCSGLLFWSLLLAFMHIQKTLQR